jgi:hypothetical protein
MEERRQKIISRKKVDMQAATPSYLAGKVFVAHPKEDDGFGFGFIKLSDDKTCYKEHTIKQYRSLWFDVGFNIFYRKERTRVWECDEIDLDEFDLYYATSAETQLFEYAFARQIKEVMDANKESEKQAM